METKYSPSHKALEIFTSKGRTQALPYALHSGCLGEYRKLKQLKVMEDSNEITAR